MARGIDQILHVSIRYVVPTEIYERRHGSLGVIVVATLDSGVKKINAWVTRKGQIFYWMDDLEVVVVIFQEVVARGCWTFGLVRVIFLE